MFKKPTTKLWQTSTQGLHPLVEKYTVGEDYILDQILLPYDIKASLAHSEMLNSIKIINKTELAKLKKALNKILDLWKKDKFQITINQEDGHTAIEQYIVKNYGEVGKKIHTGRSRNDQVLVTLRLYMLDQLTNTEKLTTTLITKFQATAKKHKNIPMPGYTHMQKAMPTTVDTWLNSYTDALKDTLITLTSTKKILNQNPLGSAAGFGIKNLKLDRTKTTKLLKFAKTQTNPLYCGLSRGHFENITLQALSQIMTICAKFANDMMLFTMQETSFFSLPDKFVTGSSIMPQKKNYDLFEIMRGNSKVFASHQFQIQNIITSVGSGYHRDYQLIKPALIQGIILCTNTLELLTTIIPNLKPNKKNLEAAMTPDLYATEEVYKQVNAGKSFREAYLKIKKTLNK